MDVVLSVTKQCQGGSRPNC